MNTSQSQPVRFGALLPYLALGIVFGVTATKSQIISWYRIQEMFRFQGFHMYGVLFSAVVVGALGVTLIRRRRLRDLGGHTVAIPPKNWGGGYRYWIGGILFGLGWGIAGACPGPIFALIGNGVPGGVALLLSALLGTWIYALLRAHLPH